MDVLGVEPSTAILANLIINNRIYAQAWLVGFNREHPPRFRSPFPLKKEPQVVYSQPVKVNHILGADDEIRTR